MKVKELIELLSKLDPELPIITVTQEEDYREGITPIYTGRARRYYPASDPNLEGYNVWGEWYDCGGLDKEITTPYFEAIITNKDPTHYMLGCW